MFAVGGAGGYVTEFAGKEVLRNSLFLTESTYFGIFIMIRNRIPLIPLPSLLLPEGKAALYIENSGIVKVIKASYASATPIGVCTENQSQDKDVPFFTLGTLCYVVDFEELENGAVNVTFQGEQSFQLVDVSSTIPGAWQATVELMPLWEARTLPLDRKFLVDALNSVFSSRQYFKNLYQNPALDDLTWVCQRWIEILPVAESQKQKMVENGSLSQVINFVSGFVKKHSERLPALG